MADYREIKFSEVTTRNEIDQLVDVGNVSQLKAERRRALEGFNKQKDAIETLDYNIERKRGSLRRIVKGGAVPLGDPLASKTKNEIENLEEQKRQSSITQNEWRNIYNYINERISELEGRQPPKPPEPVQASQQGTVMKQPSSEAMDENKKKMLLANKYHNMLPKLNVDFIEKKIEWAEKELDHTNHQGVKNVMSNFIMYALQELDRRGVEFELECTNKKCPGGNEEIPLNEPPTNCPICGARLRFKRK